MKSQADAIADYKIEIETTDIAQSGDTGNVYMNISDAELKMETGHLTLQPVSGAFVAGETEAHTVPSTGSLMSMAELEVWHSKQTEGTWHCKSIVVTNLSTGHRAVFPCNQWVPGEETGASRMLLRPMVSYESFADSQNLRRTRADRSSSSLQGGCCGRDRASGCGTYRPGFHPDACCGIRDASREPISASTDGQWVPNHVPDHEWTVRRHKRGCVLRHHRHKGLVR